MTTTINASTSAGLVQTADTSGALALQTAGTTALTISSAQVVNFANAPTVAGGAIVSAATPTVRGTVWGSGDTGALGNQSLGYNAALNSDGVNASNQTAIGQGALQLNVTASWNTALGFKTLYNNSSGYNNTACGGIALYSNTTGYNNTACGTSAGYANTTGIRSTFIGQAAGNNLATGDAGIYIGWGCAASSTSVSNETVIGANLTGKGAATTFIGTSSAAAYQGNNSATWSVASDQRLKKNIVDNNDGLNKITQIKVRNFEYRTADEVTELPKESAINITGVQIGAIAQELIEVLPE